jgi:hypothetical protein
MLFDDRGAKTIEQIHDFFGIDLFLYFYIREGPLKASIPFFLFGTEFS